MCLIAFPLGNRIWEDRPEASFIIKDTSLKTDKRKMWIMAVIIIALIICWVFEFLPVAEGALLAACLVIMFQIIDIKSAFADVDWNICIWLGIILALPTAISKSGLSGWLADNVLSRANMGGSPWMAFAFIITFAWVLTHFISNSTCIAIVLPIALEMCKVTGTNPLTYTIGISITSALAIATPLGAGFVAYVAMAGYNFRDFLRFGLPFAVLSLILVIVVTPLIFPFHV
jgi:di/tricarboxylate transporter